ncbi:trypsin-like peptidase domain-containing protein [Nocardioides sp. AE5]|uniref:S1C family serine protease n=1 Tax=Nocardioides sp. AE5 TaxID=2962573 RepID=UPI00288195E6|nr:trypsin-like peptidase domain-containing protein [Nocardioides sp. AE5]MDT0202107.1 trypsin-like peptidase domain-containing protein [Nocardioides sp. AE5]
MNDEERPRPEDDAPSGPEHTLPLDPVVEDSATQSFPPPAPDAVPAGRPADTWAPTGAGPQPPYGVGTYGGGTYGTGNYPSATTYQQGTAYQQAGRTAPPTSHAATGRRARMPGWFWPAACACTLVIGLLGGMLGAVIVDSIQDSRTPDGRTSGGLADVTTVNDAPLPENGSVAAVAQTMDPSTVQILAESKSGSGATGSGFFLDAEGHVVTNNHVIADAADGGTIQVVDKDYKRYKATVVGRSAVYDLAILYVEDAEGVQPAALGSSKALNVGDVVVAIGSPLGLDRTVTSGIVSALDRPVTTGSGADDQSYINAVQTDAAINPGNSGGPLVNLKGEVIGVNSAIATTGGSLGGEAGNIGVGFAIPIEQVKVTADQILRDGEAQYPVIGARVQSDEDGRGALIVEVMDGQPAEDAGLRKDDIVTALNDRIVPDSPSLIVAIRSHVPGDTVTLTVQRGNEELKLDITLDGQVG